MRYQPWSELPGFARLSRRLRSYWDLRRSSSGGQPAVASTSDGASTEGGRADLDRWVRFAAGDDHATDALASADPRPPADLLRRVQAVLDDEDASLLPAVAADDELTQAQWDTLPTSERRRYQRRQLAMLDPRLIARSTRRATSIARWLRR